MTMAGRVVLRWLYGCTLHVVVCTGPLCQPKIHESYNPKATEFLFLISKMNSFFPFLSESRFISSLKIPPNLAFISYFLFPLLSLFSPFVFSPTYLRRIYLFYVLYVVFITAKFIIYHFSILFCRISIKS
ncbi:hypothetical protein L228DRAFT_3900 [Xylona heveae TC161]|uniref:Uncharacterized protein n=1 Tax=Xylona heveae (strain CBS 132557 / TC161) TaxID=1328760 RepID=A0A165JCC7_XYLHT|nr:hypothetical protein L228DRAFT_3900 [Xylona heveae TC161]KZF26047.1 hypothetical protein L228DRAFT_3900 [Xylona heveae TC161]